MGSSTNTSRKLKYLDQNNDFGEYNDDNNHNTTSHRKKERIRCTTEELTSMPQPPNTTTMNKEKIFGSSSRSSGFVPGGASLHNCMTPHDLDGISYKKAMLDPCSHPTYFNGSLAFMNETYLPFKVAIHTLRNYHDDDSNDQKQG